MRDLPLVAGGSRHPILEQEAIQGRMRRQGRLHGYQGRAPLFVLLPALGRVGKTAVKMFQLQRTQSPQMEPMRVGFPPARPWYEREVSTFQPDDFFRIVELVSGTLGVNHESVHFETDFVRDLGATEEQRETLLKILELAYGTTFPADIRATITTPISAYIALARVGKIDDEEAKGIKDLS